MNAITVEHVYKQYKNGVLALNDFTMKVTAGEIFTLLGANGAGKSTLIRILTTFLKADEGTIQLLGKDVTQDVSAIRNEIACVSQQISIDTYLSLEENMMFQSRLYRIPKQEANARMEMLIERFDLARYRKYPVASYSGGVKRRLDIALNMMTKPTILFLDEPTTGMDITSRKEMWKMMKQIRDEFGTTIFLTTHYLEEAEQLSDTICIMKDGKVVVQGTPQTLRKLIHQRLYRIRFQDKQDMHACINVMREFLSEVKITQEEEALLFDAQDTPMSVPILAQFLNEQHLAFCGLEVVQPTIEDVFVRLTTTQEDVQWQ